MVDQIPTRIEEQARLRAAASCQNCKKIWASFLDDYCQVHSVSAWMHRLDGDSSLTEEQLGPNARIDTSASRSGRGKSFVGKQLVGMKFQGQDLRVASFRNANLQNANFEKANLERAVFVRADLRGGNLGDANLQSADLSGADMRSANLSGADLRYAILKGVNLSGANLRGSNLMGANFESNPRMGVFTNLSHADFSGANLVNTKFLDAKIDGASFCDVADAEISRIRADANFSAAQRAKWLKPLLWIVLLTGLLIIALWKGVTSIDWSPVNRYDRPFFDGGEYETPCSGDCYDMDNDGRTYNDIDGDGDGRYESP